MALKKQIATLLALLSILELTSGDTKSILGYKWKGGCYGVGSGCKNDGPEVVCCGLDPIWTPDSVEFDSLQECQAAFIYNTYSCGDPKIGSYDGGPGIICFANWPILIYSANWAWICDDEASTNATDIGSCGLHDNSPTCQYTKLPHVLAYKTPGSTNGTWILDTGSDKLAEMMAELESVDDHEREGWMLKMGADFKAAYGVGVVHHHTP